MVNMLKMDMYRLFKSKSFKIVLIVVVVLNLITGSFDRFMVYMDQKYPAEGMEPAVWDKTHNFATIIRKPINYFDCIMTLLSIVWFSHSDLAHGYIKNIAGQLPKKGHTVISKFLVVGVHNLVIFVVAVIAQTIGYLPYCTIDFSEKMDVGIEQFWLKWLLLLAISAIILLFSSGLKSKNAATTIAVLMGGKILSTTYALLDLGLHKLQIKFLDDFYLSEYMPDALMGVGEADVKKAIVVSCVIIVAFMTATVKIFNKRDVN